MRGAYFFCLLLHYLFLCQQAKKVEGFIYVEKGREKRGRRVIGEGHADTSTGALPMKLASASSMTQLDPMGSDESKRP